MAKETYYIGEQSLTFPNDVYISSSASVVGKKEGEGPLGNAFDMICQDDKFGEDTWEMAESTLQKEALSLALGKAGVKPEDVRYLFAGDLLGQNIATSFGLMDYEIPLFGLYGACSTAGENLFRWPLCALAQDMPKPWRRLHPATLPARKSSFDFPWSMPIKDPYRLPGPSPEAEPFSCPAKKETYELPELPLVRSSIWESKTL